MSKTPREIVKDCLTFNTPERIPIDIWSLPCFTQKYPEEFKKLTLAYPSDICYAPNIYNKSLIEKGNPYEVGEYTDEWGCVFKNIHYGVIGEVKNPLLTNINDLSNLKPPHEILPADDRRIIKIVNKAYHNSDKFMLSSCCPRPWERFQFLRGTENAMVDLILNPEATKKALSIIHEFYKKELEFWVKTDVDAIMFMDDWGSQKNLLISPSMWRAFFKPLYKEYCDIAKENNKFIFMHSDGCITKIYEDLIEIGVNAINSQLFCMNMKELSKIAKGNITFWGEIDRQHILTSNDTNLGRKAVQTIAKYLYSSKGGIITQFELGPGANPDIAFAIMDEWKTIKQ